VSDDTLSGGRCKFRRQQFRSTEEVERWRGGEVEWFFVAEGYGELIFRRDKVQDYPK
jgi:hypothetical protein